MKFKAGDAIVHPMRGAGVVVRIEEQQWHGSSTLYYRIELLNQTRSSLMIPTSAAKKIGLRRAIPKSKLKQVWRVLRADPKKLPADHKTRYKLLEEKLHAGDVFEVAEAVRDMAWRKEQEKALTTMGKRIYQEGMTLLAGEIAAAQDIALTDAEAQIRTKLSESLSPNAAV